jgi:hypothetical protein
LQPVKTLERDPQARGEIRYTQDGKASAYPVREKGLYALWITPVDGSAGKAVTEFGPDFIEDFHWSAANNKLALIRSHRDSGIVLLRKIAA